MSKKPDSLKALYDALAPRYSTWHEKVKRSRDAYYRKFHNQIGLPEGVPVHESSTARNLVDNLADQLRTDEPRVVFDALGASKKAQDQRDLMVLWGQHILEGIDRESIISVWEQVKHDLIRDSAACVKFLVNMDALPEAPEDNKSLKEWRTKRAATWAYEVWAVDPLQVLPAPGRRNPPAYVLERQQRLEEEVKEDYPEYRTGEERGYKPSPVRMVDWLEFWSEEYYICEVEGQRIIDKPNPYGFIPYAWEYNGLGRHDISGNLAFLGEPVLESIMGELEEEVRVKTAMSAQWQYHVFPRLITTLAAAVAKRMFMKGPGAIITVADMAQKPQWMEVTPPNQQMVNFLSEIKANIAARFPPGLNQREPGVEAALHQALLQGQATKPLQPIKNALNRLASTVVNGMARQAKAMYLDTSVWGRGDKAEKGRMVKAEDFTSFNFHVSFEATDAAEDDRKLLTGTAMLRIPGLLSYETFYEKFGLGLGVNYEEERVRVNTEAVIQQFIASGVLTEALVQEMQAQEQAAAQQGMVGTVKEQALEALGGLAGGGSPPVGPSTPGAGSRTMEEVAGVAPPASIPQQALVTRAGGA